MNAILAGFRAKRDAQLSVVLQGQERETVYLDLDEEGGGDRSSVWSDAHSRGRRHRPPGRRQIQR